MPVTRAALAVVAAVFVFLALGPNEAFALPRDGLEPPDVGGADPFVPPANGFSWSVPSRFGLWNPNTGMVDYHWDQTNAVYDPAYVNPTSFPANFDGCQTQADENASAAGSAPALQYDWALVDATGSATPMSSPPPGTPSSCFLHYVFPAQGLYTVRLTTTDSSGAAAVYTQPVNIRDLLVVSIGDSYGSGEGNPDIPQKWGPFGVTAGPQWEDRRCHRSEYAAPAVAAMQLEASDPHSSVTFLSFACSGATINTAYASNADPLDPFLPITPDLQHNLGTGVLGPYAGTEPPDVHDMSVNQLPSQIAQLKTALGPSPRHIDAMLVSAGGNDMGFGPIAQLCILYPNCQSLQVPDVSGVVPTSLDTRMLESVNGLSAGYDALATALAAFDIGHVYLNEYPDPTSADNGGLCSVIMPDVIPPVMKDELGGLALAEGHPVPTLPFQIDGGDTPGGGEVGWAAHNVLTALNGAVAAGATAHHWTLVDGIADARGNLFAGHGYCATDNWIRTAIGSVIMQGPVHAISLQPDTTQTKGVLHPTIAGHYAVAQRILAHLYPDLIPPTPAPPPAPAKLSLSSAITLSDGTSATAQVGAGGWLTGECTASGCTSGDAVSSVTLSADSATQIRGVSATVNGAPCLSVPNVDCTGTLVDPATYTYSLRFHADGVYAVDFTVRQRNGALTKLSHEFKVDLHDPTAATATTSTAPSGTGWYQAPQVSFALDGTDAPGGSDIRGINYALDGSIVALAGRGQTVQVAGEGAHLLEYWPVDNAGRTGPHTVQTVNIDSQPANLTCSAPDSSWHATDQVSTCAASDATSGLASAADAAFSLATSVPGDTETANAYTSSRNVCDVAGNCLAAGPVGPFAVDKKPPAVVISAPSAIAYTLGQSVAASYSCTDGGSGVATCTGPVAPGSGIDTGSVGTKTFAVSGKDNVGNTAGAAVSYSVSYAISVLYDQSAVHQAGSVVPVKLALCDASGHAVSAAAIVVTATSLSKLAATAVGTPTASGAANPDNNFRYDVTVGPSGGYVYNLSTKGLTTGVWDVGFSVAGDPVTHHVQFAIR